MILRGRMVVVGGRLKMEGMYYSYDWWLLLYQFSSVAQLCPTLCDPMHCSTPGFPVHHQPLDLTQTHVHWVVDATQPSHPVIPFCSHLESFPASWSFQMSQFFASGGQSIGLSVSVLPMNTQDWFPLEWTGWKPIQHCKAIQFSCSVMSDSLQPHEPQHIRPPCPSPTPRVYLNSCPLSWWCHPTISSSVVPFFSCPQSLPASGSYQMSQLFASGGKTIWVSASISVLPMNTQGWRPLGWTSWISLQSKGLQRIFSKTTVQKHQLFSVQLSL